MSNIAHHRCPRAGVDPIRSAPDALAVVTMALHLPPRPETIALVLDDRRCGSALVVVDGTTEPDSFVEVVECLARAAAARGADRVGSLVVATVRPTIADEDARGGDVDRWLDASDTAATHGVELLEWFVVGPPVVVGPTGHVVARCPRDDLGEPPRW